MEVVKERYRNEREEKVDNDRGEAKGGWGSWGVGGWGKGGGRCVVVVGWERTDDRDRDSS
jgi:hypothetical protein